MAFDFSNGSGCNANLGVVENSSRSAHINELRAAETEFRNHWAYAPQNGSWATAFRTKLTAMWGYSNSTGCNVNQGITTNNFVRSAHINELRAAINSLRTTACYCTCICACTCTCHCQCHTIFGCPVTCVQCGSNAPAKLPAFKFSNSTGCNANQGITTNNFVRSAHINELRAKINDMCDVNPPRVGDYSRVEGCGTTSF